MEVQPFHCRQLTGAHLSPQPDPGVPGDEPEDAQDSAGPWDAEGSHASPLAPKPSCMPEGADPPPGPFPSSCGMCRYGKNQPRGQPTGWEKSRQSSEIIYD